MQHRQKHTQRRPTMGRPTEHGMAPQPSSALSWLALPHWSCGRVPVSFSAGRSRRVAAILHPRGPFSRLLFRSLPLLRASSAFSPPFGSAVAACQSSRALLTLPLPARLLLALRSSSAWRATDPRLAGSAKTARPPTGQQKTVAKGGGGPERSGPRVRGQRRPTGKESREKAAENGQGPRQRRQQSPERRGGAKRRSPE